MKNTLTKREIDNCINELEQVDSSMGVDFSQNGDEDIHLTALGKVVLTKSDMELIASIRIMFSSGFMTKAY